MFKGSYVAIATPFSGDRVDEEKLKDLVDFHVKNGTQGIVPCGTTGESATLSHEEHRKVVKVVVKQAAGRVKVIAGTGSNSTKEAVELTKQAKDIGADAVLLINPYYNKPVQEGLYRHFASISDAVDIPMVLYNIPSRTGVNLAPITLKKLCDYSGKIVAIKEASGNLDQMISVLKLCGDRIILLSGDDALLLPVLAIGGRGVVSVAANIVPSQVQTICDLYMSADIRAAHLAFYKLYPLVKALFLETNPIPVKAAMKMIGLLDDASLRLPMTEMLEPNKKLLSRTLSDYGLKLVAASN